MSRLSLHFPFIVQDLLFIQNSTALELNVLFFSPLTTTHGEDGLPTTLLSGETYVRPMRGGSLGLRSGDHTIIQAYIRKRQAFKRRNNNPQVRRPISWQGQAPELVEGEGDNITHEKKKILNPQVWRPTYWQGQAPEHVEGEGSEEHKQSIYSMSTKEIEVVKYLIINNT